MTSDKFSQMWCIHVLYCRHRSRSNSKVFKQLDLDLPVSEMYLLFPCVWRRSPVTDPGFARGDANLGGALTCYSIWHNFTKNCMKNETSWIGGGALPRSVDPPLLSVMMLRGICRLVIRDLPSVLITLWSCNSKLVSFITPVFFIFPERKRLELILMIMKVLMDHWVYTIDIRWVCRLNSITALISVSIYTSIVVAVPCTMQNGYWTHFVGLQLRFPVILSTSWCRQ